MNEQAGILRGKDFLSADDLNLRALRAARALHSVGVAAGDTVALLLRNDTAFFEASFAAGLLGAAPVPMNWHSHPDDILFVLQDSKAKLLVAHADLIRPVLDRLPMDLEVRVVPTPADIGRTYRIPEEIWSVPAGLTDWLTWIGGFQPWANAPQEAPAAMMYTSGTTGKPKGVRRPTVSLDRRATSAYYADVARISGLERAPRAIVTGPLYHGGPLAWAMGWVRMRGFVVLQARFDPEDLLRLIERHRITHLCVVPIMFTRLLKLPAEVRGRHDVSSLEHVTHGAAPCPRHIKEQMIAWWGPIIYEQYGSLEIGLVTGADSAEWLAHPGTVGKPLAGVELRILDDDGREVPVGEPGEVFTRVGDQPDFTYEGRPEARAEIDRDGFVTAGDVGYLDGDGFLYLCDRKKDMVISGGVNIFPAEIEECLLTLRGVRDAAVFGIPDDEYGESLAAAIELDGSVSLSEDDVRAHVRANLAGFKTPRRVEFMDEIPRLDSGKILKRKLREAYWAGTGRTI
ncbi:acyl-CoA synthetase [Caulobacter sp. KR2-114]|uniref:acyl-CoA synthetase n=1 Tax=Caulobacter sp. KR2-114 TaxID=3400912 RepID=UPI003C098F97